MAYPLQLHAWLSNLIVMIDPGPDQVTVIETTHAQGNTE
jgi:hypothetical protein